VYKEAKSQFDKERQRQNGRFDQIETDVVSQCERQQDDGKVDEKNQVFRQKRLFFDFAKKDGCNLFE
jgi:hypothetical protein